jgi:hypothetical protein
LSESGGTGQPDVDVEALRAKGGPFYRELRDAIAEATRDGRAVGGAEVFNSLPQRARRPVDIHGLMHVAAQQWALQPDAAAEEFNAIRSTGEEVTYLVPEITFVSGDDDRGAG